MKILILAGGFGTRLRPLTNNIPKPMININGKPFLHYLIEQLRLQGFNDFIIATHYLAHIITNYFGDGKKYQINIVYSHEHSALGSAGAIKLSEKLIGNEDFIVINGDTYSEINLKKIIKFHKETRTLCSLIVSNLLKSGDVITINKNHSIVYFGKSSLKMIKKPVYNAGTFIFSHAIFNFIPSNKFYSIENDLIPNLLENNHKLYAYSVNCYIKDMGSIEQLTELSNYLTNKQ